MRALVVAPVAESKSASQICWRAGAAGKEEHGLPSGENWMPSSPGWPTVSGFASPPAIGWINKLRCFGVLLQIDRRHGVAQPFAVGRDGGCAETLHVHHVFEGHGPFCVLGWSEGGGEEECEEDGSAHEFFPVAEVVLSQVSDARPRAPNVCRREGEVYNRGPAFAVRSQLVGGGMRYVLSHPCFARMGHPGLCGSIAFLEAGPSLRLPHEQFSFAGPPGCSVQDDTVD